MDRLPLLPVAPNWFAAVMGTSIIATAAHGLPSWIPGLDALAWAAWGLAGLTLITLTVGTAQHLARDKGAMRRYLKDPAVAPAYGTVAMAPLAFGTATLLVAPPLLGHGAVVLDAVLWCLGTAIGLTTAAGAAARRLARRGPARETLTGAALLPVVPPMVSAAGGALLLPHVEGVTAHALALACAAMMGAAGLAALVITVQLWSRLLRHPLEAAAVPTLWLVLGPLGQGVTAMALLADHAGPALGLDTAALTLASVAVGLPLLCFALLWLSAVGVATARARRKGMPFTLAWWAFTFPVGTLVTGSTALAVHTGALALTALAVVLFALLLAGWWAAARGSAHLLYAAVSSRFIRATQPGPWYTKAV